jgi:hypothetical protein
MDDIKKYFPLRVVVTTITNEADPENEEEVVRAVRSWYNRLASGTISRDLFVKIGGKLYLDYGAFLASLERQKKPVSKPGRPRSA